MTDERVCLLVYAQVMDGGLWGARSELFGIAGCDEAENALVLPDDVSGEDLQFGMAHELVRAHQRGDRDYMAALAYELASSLRLNKDDPVPHLIIKVSPDGVTPGIVSGLATADEAEALFLKEQDKMAREALPYTHWTRA